MLLPRKIKIILNCSFTALVTDWKWALLALSKNHTLFKCFIHNDAKILRIFSPGKLLLFATQILCYKDTAVYALTYFSYIFLFSKATAEKVLLWRYQIFSVTPNTHKKALYQTQIHKDTVRCPFASIQNKDFY